jgi:hypothetical protein
VALLRELHALRHGERLVGEGTGGLVDDEVEEVPDVERDLDLGLEAVAEPGGFDEAGEDRFDLVAVEGRVVPGDLVVDPGGLFEVLFDPRRYPGLYPGGTTAPPRNRGLLRMNSRPGFCIESQYVSDHTPANG